MWSEAARGTSCSGRVTRSLRGATVQLADLRAASWSIQVGWDQDRRKWQGSTAQAPGGNQVGGTQAPQQDDGVYQRHLLLNIDRWGGRFVRTPGSPGTNGRSGDEGAVPLLQCRERLGAKCTSHNTYPYVHPRSSCRAQRLHTHVRHRWHDLRGPDYVVSVDTAEQGHLSPQACRRQR